MKKIFKVLFFAITVIALLIPLGYWIYHPNLTAMEVFIKTGWVYMPVFLVLAILNKYDL